MKCFANRQRVDLNRQIFKEVLHNKLELRVYVEDDS